MVQKVGKAIYKCQIYLMKMKEPKDSENLLASFILSFPKKIYFCKKSIFFIMKKISKTKIQETIIKLIDTYQPLSVYLFGSYAWGKPHAESDLDLMLIVPEGTVHNFELRRKGNRALAGIGFSVDFLFNTPTNFDTLAEHPSSLEYKIKNEGKLVYDATRTMALQS